MLSDGHWCFEGSYRVHPQGKAVQYPVILKVKILHFFRNTCYCFPFDTSKHLRRIESSFSDCSQESATRRYSEPVDSCLPRLLILCAKAVTVQGSVVIHLYQPMHMTWIGSRAQAVILLGILSLIPYPQPHPVPRSQYQTFYIFIPFTPFISEQLFNPTATLIILNVKFIDVNEISSTKT